MTLPIKLPVRAEFSEFGGYDCMSAAWIIYERDGWLRLFEIDCARFGAEGHEPSPAAEQMAKFIVESLNLRMPIEPISPIDDVWAAEHRLIAEAEEESGRSDWRRSK